MFQEEEEILQDIEEEAVQDDQGHVPTAQRVTQIFSGADLSDDENEELEEVDFADLGRIRAEVDAAPINPTASTRVTEEQFTGHYTETTIASSSTIVESSTAGTEVTIEKEEISIDIAPTPAQGSTPIPATDDSHPVTTTLVESVEVQLDVMSIDEKSLPDANMAPPPEPLEGKEDLFYVDTTPAPIPMEMKPPPLPVLSEQVPDDDDDVIVYVAPHPRRATPAATPQVKTSPLPTAPPAHESVSFSFANSPAPKLRARKQAPVLTPRARRQTGAAARQRAARINKRRVKGGFASFGAIMSEARLHDEEENRDPQFDERRRGDSDVDWGDEDETGDGVAEGMQLDDMQLDEGAMKNFVQSLSPSGSQWVSAGDIEDDASQNATSSDSEADEDEEDVFDAEEQMLIGEESESEEMEVSDDEESSPRTGFQARLERLRKNARSKRPRLAPPSSEEEDDDDDDFDAWADEDDDLIAEIQDILDENEDILAGRSRKERNRLFRAVRDGDFDEMMLPAVSKRAKRNSLSAALQAQWDIDRSKKAERKRLREQAKLLVAADPLGKKKGGKKGRKAMLAAARLAGDPITVLPNQIMSMLTLEQQIRRFLQTFDGPDEMTLPPMDKSTRKQVHEMANAFNLKSVSKGNGKSRYTTLIKTSKTGRLTINEKKVTRLVRMDRGWSAPGDWSRGGKGKVHIPKHQDGDEVGKAAPKIGETNVGFQMLASMGWSEGQKIGISGGLDAPLTAIIKNTKLGLGATR